MYDINDIKARCRSCIGGQCMEQCGDNEGMPESEFRMNSFCCAGPTGHLKCPVSVYCKGSDMYRPDLMK